MRYKTSFRNCPGRFLTRTAEQLGCSLGYTCTCFSISICICICIWIWIWVFMNTDSAVSVEILAVSFRLKFRTNQWQFSSLL
eukprot:g4989.t1